MGTKLVAISGGIGSGKSIVSDILRINQFDVYDCDTEAKRIMDSDYTIHKSLCKQIHPNAVSDHHIINRKIISDIVFYDNNKLNILNNIVHEAVKNDIKNRLNTPHHNDLLFVETAILYQSGIDLMANVVWEITAPIDIRVNRVMQRNRCSKSDVEARIQAQDSFIHHRHHPNTIYISNDNTAPLLPQIFKALNEI